MQDRIEMLRQVPLFQSLPAGSLKIIAGLLSDDYVDEGMEVIREGEPADRLYLLVEGEVEVIKGYLQENATALGVFGPVATFGEMGLIDKDTRSATVVTTERSHFFTLDREPFQILIQNNIEICHSLLQEMCRRLRQADEIASTR